MDERYPDPTPPFQAGLVVCGESLPSYSGCGDLLRTPQVPTWTRQGGTDGIKRRGRMSGPLPGPNDTKIQGHSRLRRTNSASSVWFGWCEWIS